MKTKEQDKMIYHLTAEEYTRLDSTADWHTRLLIEALVTGLFPTPNHKWCAKTLRSIEPNLTPHQRSYIFELMTR